MKTEGQLRVLLHELADPRSPEVGAWQRFQTRRTHANRKRLAVAVLAAVVGIGAALSIPRLLPDRLPPPTGPDYPVSTYQDRILKYQFDYPQGWVREGYVGDRVAVAPSQGALNGDDSANAPSLFALGVAPGMSFDTEAAAARSKNSEAARAGASVSEGPAEMDGRRALRFTIRWPVTENPHGCETSGCRVETIIIDWTSERSLVVDILAANESYWTQYGDEGRQIVESIRAFEPPKNMYIPSHGTFSILVPEDELTEAVLRFMDARAEGDGAEPWLSTKAAGQYETAGSGEYPQGLRLYPAPRFTWRFMIASRTERSDGQALFEVRVLETRVLGAGQPMPLQPAIVERIVLGPRTVASGGAADLVAISATRAPECEAPPGALCL